MAIWNKVNQDYLNQERSLFEVFNVATKDGEQVSVDNPFPVSLGSSSITINGDVVIPGSVEISNDEGSPIPTQSHIFDENDNEYSASNPLTVDGTVNIGTMPEVEIKNDTGNPIPITGTVATSPPVGTTDAFGRTRVSNPLTLFDSSHRYRDSNLWESLVVGTGATVGFSTTEGLVNIGIGTTSGLSLIHI